MLVIKKACDEMKELLYEAKERAELAIDCKSKYPMLWKYEHKVYVEKYEKAKLKIAMYSKM